MIHEGHITHGIAKVRARGTTPITKQTVNRMTESNNKQKQPWRDKIRQQQKHRQP